MPALMRLPTNATGFSTKRSMRDAWFGLCTTTPYLDGSSTLVTTMVPSSPCARWKGRRQGLDLVEDHALVAELDQRLGEGEALLSVSLVCCSVDCWASAWWGSSQVRGHVRGGEDGCRSHPRG